MHLRMVTAAVLAVLASLMAWSALAASGTALGVDPQAEASTGGKPRVLIVGADISIGDRVTTGPKGQVQILFSDKTELVVGPNSSLAIEDYLLREDNSAGKLAINALSGTFRFATGGAAKERYVIKTPSGTIGVRGTAFDLTVDDLETEVLLFHGAVLLCNLANVCVTLDGSCQIGTYDLSEAINVGPAAGTTGEERREFKEAFEYAENQSPLLRQFWVATARQCFNQGFVGNAMPDLPANSAGGGGNPTPDNEPPPCDCDCEYISTSYYDDDEGGCDAE